MKIFVLGSTGMLGNYVYTYLSLNGFDVIPVNRNMVDAMTATKQMLRTCGIRTGDVVINCIGLIKQHSTITDLEYVTVNSLFPLLLDKVCNDIGAKFIHVTTDCVFSGTKGNYIETDIHDAVDTYGRSKSLGEPKDSTVIRTSIIGEESKNKLSLLEWVKSQDGNTINGFTNHFWNGITCLQFAKISEAIIKTKSFWKGVRHFTSSDALNKYELVRSIVNIFNLNIKVLPKDTETICDRTLSTIYKDTIISGTIESQLVELKDFNILNKLK